MDYVPLRQVIGDVPTLDDFPVDDSRDSASRLVNQKMGGLEIEVKKSWLCCHQAAVLFEDRKRPFDLFGCRAATGPIRSSR